MHGVKNVAETTFDIAQEEFARKDLEGTYLVKAFLMVKDILEGV